MLKVGVVGAAGRMGRTVCQAVCEDPELELCAVVDPRIDSLDLGELSGPAGGLQSGTRVEDMDGSGAQVVVDFTVADAAASTMRWCASHALHAVVGTTGMPEDVVSEMKRLFSESEANCVIAPNFAIGAVLLMRFAELAAPFMDGAEIVELHHDGKLDAPSGTAILSAARIAGARLASGRAPWPGDRTTSEVIAGPRGAQGAGGIRIHSVRLPGLVAHQEVIMGAPGQSLTIRHDAYDRTSFMPGVILAVKSVPQLSGLTVGLEPLLGL